MKAKKMRTGILEKLGEVITILVSRVPRSSGRSREGIQRLRGLQTVNFHLSMRNHSPYGLGTTACTWFEYALSVPLPLRDRKSTRLNSSHVKISYAVFCL